MTSEVKTHHSVDVCTIRYATARLIDFSLFFYPIQWILRFPLPPRRTWRFSERFTVILLELLNAPLSAATSNASLLPTTTAAAFHVLSLPRRRRPRSAASADCSRERRADCAAFRAPPLPVLLLPAVEMEAVEPVRAEVLAVLAVSLVMLVSNWLGTRHRSFRHFRLMLSFSMFQCELFSLCRIFRVIFIFSISFFVCACDREWCAGDARRL